MSNEIVVDQVTRSREPARTPASDLDPSDRIDPIVSEVRRFAERSIAPRVERPERPMTARELEAALCEASTLGIVASEAASGFATWEEGPLDAGIARSWRILFELAKVNAGFALAVHGASLARWIASRSGVSLRGNAAVALHGGFGLGRIALARHLAGAPLDDDDRSILLDLYAPASARWVTAQLDPACIAIAELDDRSRLQWRFARRDALDIEVHPNAHGFDELATVRVRRRAGDDGCTVSSQSDDESRELFLGALGRMSIGLVAVGLGAAQHAHGLARAQASTRVQGGRTIDGHAAVQLLLASSARALATVESLLAATPNRTLARHDVARVLQLRAEAHPLLRRAANDAMQVFGGSGYMRDGGLEKIVRDQNHLAALCGSTSELSLIVAEWERLDG